MPTVSSVTKFFPSAKEGFTTTLASTIGSGAATVPLNSITGYTNGDTVVMVIEPSNATNKQAFTGVVDTAGVQLTGVVWTEGTNTTHTTGSTVVDYVTATHMAMVTKGLLVSHNQDGTLKTSAVSSSTMLASNVVTPAKLSSNVQLGWEDGLLPAVSSVAANGNHSYNVTFASTVAALLSPGMRLRTTRTVAAPTQCTSLNGTTQFYSRASGSVAGMTFTDDFTVSAWVKMTSYANGGIASRFNGTSGWYLYITSSGQVQLGGANGGAGNVSLVQSYQSIPLNKWVHVSANLDMSAFATNTDGGATGSCITIDGINVPASVSRSGTNPTAIIQAGNLEIGSINGGTSPFPGKIAQVAIYNTKITNATNLASMNQTLTGSETSLISAYSFNNSINDLNANANNLTANGSAVATNADSPFGGQADGTISSTLDYAIVTKVATTVATVQVPEGCTIPTTGGVTSADMSAWKAPYLFPTSTRKWELETILNSTSIVTGSIASAWGAFTGSDYTFPVGVWKQRSALKITGINTVAAAFTLQTQWDTATPTVNRPGQHVKRATTATGFDTDTHRHHETIELSAQTTYRLYGEILAGSGTQTAALETYGSPLTLENAYL
jgi:hypothetical protein